MKKDHKLKNLKVGQKLKHSYVNIFRAVAVIIAVAIIGVGFISYLVSSFYNEHYTNTALQLEIKKDIELIGKNVLWTTTTNGEEKIAELLATIEEHAGYVAKNVEKLEKNFSKAELSKEMVAAIAELDAAREKVVGHVKEKDGAKAMVAFNGDYTEAAEKVQDVLDRVGESTDTQAKLAYQITMIIGIVLVIVVLLCGVGGITVAYRCSKTITNIIVEPIKEVEAAAQQLKDGNLDIHIDYQSEDELGGLAENFREACDKMKEIIGDSGRILTEMANGNFTVVSESPESYIGDFKVLLDNLIKLDMELVETLKQINEASSQVAIGAEQMSESAQALAEGATDQAGAVEELTATITNVAEISETSAEAADVAAAAAKESAEGAEKSHQDMDELVSAMERITETSTEIENIIGTIEKIAQQTNLLSLNASIEAARAGEAGRGFAVVADQIGTLAADSAKSAVMTRDLISKSLEEINKGNDIVEKTMSAMASVLASMEQFAQMAGGSAESSREQANMLKEVEKGIEQISVVVENNSASAEETSAISQELTAQAETLQAMVAQFKLRD